MPLFLSGLSYH